MEFFFFFCREGGHFFFLFLFLKILFVFFSLFLTLSYAFVYFFFSGGGDFYSYGFYSICRERIGCTTLETSSR